MAVKGPKSQAPERVTLRLPSDVAKRVRAAAKKNRVSVNTYMTGAAMFAVDKGLAFFHDAPPNAAQNG